MKILITGFEPFGDNKRNPTQLLVEAFNMLQVTLPENCQFEARTLPVTFGQAFEELERSIESFNPDTVLALGLAAGRSSIELERIAINCMDAEIADNDGVRPVDEEITPGGPAGYFTTLPLGQLVADLRRRGIAVRVSNSAGTYVCNYLFYRLMELARRRNLRCGFVHVPEESVLPLPELIRAVEELIRSLDSQPSPGT